MSVHSKPLLTARDLKKSYGTVEVLRGVSFELYPGEAACIMGSSGAGKSTLLHLLGTLDRPSAGQVNFGDKELLRMNDDELSHFRNLKMGFVFQFHHLLAEFSALENVMMPALLGGESFSESRTHATQLLGELGLSHRLTHRPGELSGGEQQRVAIARALVRKPQVLFADEPTGNLDAKNGEAVQQILFDLQRKRQLSMVVVTHDALFARRFPRVRHLRDGQWLG
jgi:lipoprotein-releasing system ATP-binding protein